MGENVDFSRSQFASDSVIRWFESSYPSHFDPASHSAAQGFCFVWMSEEGALRFYARAPSLWGGQAFFGEKPGFAPNFSPKLAFPPRVCYNGGMERVNFHAQMLETLKTVPQGEKLLLHSCCGPCSSRCLEALKDAFAVTVFYYNPNITDAAEYAHRKSEQLRFLQETGWADFLDCDYAPQEFFSAAAGLEGEPEGGARCYECYRLRLERTARTAAERGFGWFCSTLSVSPHKNAAWLNEIGAALGQKYGVRWLYNDFKKQNGYLRSVRLAEEYGLYRQNYCGCLYSDWTKRPSDGKTK